MTRLLAIIAACVLSAGTAQAQAYPTRPITIVVPFAPGGLPDVLTRVVIEGMRGPLGQALIVENVSGANGTIATNRVVRAAPDGYTFIAGVWNTHVANGAVYSLDYDVTKDFEPVGMIGGAPLLFTAKTALKANTMAELVEWLKANPGQATAGSVGNGGPDYLILEMLKKRAGVQFATASYRGAGVIVHDVVAGQIDFAILNPTTALPQAQAGTLKALAATSAQRLPLAPNVPTMAESGYPDLQISQWVALFAPRGTPKAIVDKVNAALVAALEDATLRERIAAQGTLIAPREMQSPEALAAFQQEEIKRWWPVIKEAGLKAN